MRAEEGDETIKDYAEEAVKAKDNVAPEPSGWRRVWRALTFRRGQ